MTEENNIKNVGFIGGGPISAAICKGILKNDLFSNNNIWVSPIYDNFLYWKEIGANIKHSRCHGHAEVFDNSQLIFLESEPENFGDCIGQCYSRLNAVPKPPINDVLFISMVQGVHTEQLRKRLFYAREYPIHPPNFGIGRILTNNLFGVGNGVCLYSVGQTNQKLRLLENRLVMILSTGGACQKVTEDILHLMSPLINCGPAFIYLVIEAIAEGAVKQGVPRKQAQTIAAHIVASSGEMALQSGTHPAMLKDEVCEPGAIDGISVLEDGSLRSLFIKAVEASSLKFNEAIEKFQKWVG